jgi:hypothetical protein
MPGNYVGLPPNCILAMRIVGQFRLAQSVKAIVEAWEAIDLAVQTLSQIEPKREDWSAVDGNLESFRKFIERELQAAAEGLNVNALEKEALALVEAQRVRSVGEFSSYLQEMTAI